MKNTYLEQMKAEAPTLEEALLRYEYIVDFVTDCIPDYQPHMERKDNYEPPHRMKIVELLMTKTPGEIKQWFEEELKSPKLRQYKETFEKLCKEFKEGRNKRHYIIDLHNFLESLKKFSSEEWTAYEKKYDEFQLPKGYTTVSAIWGDIFENLIFGREIVNFFIQCAEDNAPCTLVNYVEKENVKCQKVSWHAFQYTNKCKEGQCADINCKGKNCKVDKCKTDKTVKIKPLCAFCKVAFSDRVKQELHIDLTNIHIEDTSNSDDLEEGGIGDYLLSFATVSHQETESTSNQMTLNYSNSLNASENHGIS